MEANAKIPLPKDWPKHVKTAILHVISLARVALVAASGRAARSRKRMCAFELNFGRHDGRSRFWKRSFVSRICAWAVFVLAAGRTTERSRHGDPGLSDG